MGLTYPFYWQSVIYVRGKNKTWNEEYYTDSCICHHVPWLYVYETLLSSTVWLLFQLHEAGSYLTPLYHQLITKISIYARLSNVTQ